MRKTRDRNPLAATRIVPSTALGAFGATDRRMPRAYFALDRRRIEPGQPFPVKIAVRTIPERATIRVPRCRNDLITSALNKKITYFFRVESGAVHRFDVEFDRPPAGGDLPLWTRLESDKCPHCPLASAPNAHCPAAADLVPVVERFSALSSIERVDVLVSTPEYDARKRTDTQTALSALMGLILATSACPILARLRPMAELHRPFATSTEVVYRIISMHLLGCFLRGEAAGLQGLREFFADIERLNQAFSGRLNRAAERDAGINALLALHYRSMQASLSLDQEIENIRGWFALAPAHGAGEAVRVNGNGAPGG